MFLNCHSFHSLRYGAYNTRRIQRHGNLKDSFGIIAPNGAEPQEIILWFDEHQGNYVKSMPLHHSQQILEDGKTGLKIRLFLVPTYDFEREVLSFGNRVKILAPENLKEKIKIETKEMLKNLI